MQSSGPSKRGRLRIRTSRMSDMRLYSALVQRACQDAYSNARLGLPSELFSERVFASRSTKRWLASNLGERHGRTWLAFIGKRLVGAITVREAKRVNELKGFYVSTDSQGTGVGGELFMKALRLSEGKDLKLLVYPHNSRTIAIYRRWGFRRYGRSGYQHWSAWPRRTRVGYILMRLRRDRLARLLASFRRNRSAAPPARHS